MEASEQPPEQDSELKKHRSPAYPSITLDKALDRTQRLWDVAGKHPAPMSSALKAWGYGAKSSGGLQTVAALKQYGLAKDEGTGWNRRVSLTKAAQELLVYGADKDSPEWKPRIRAAALKPKIHRELWEKYEGDLPDDSVIRPYLVLERGFSNEAADTMLKRFRASIAFAGVTGEADTVSPNAPDANAGNEGNGANNGEGGLVSPPTIEQEPQNPTPPAVPQQPGTTKRAQRTIQVTYSPTDWALVQGVFPMSEADWEAFLATLEGMKRGLVTRD